MNRLDRVIGYFAPTTAIKRIRARNAIRAYEGAAVGRRSSAWKTLHTAANAEIQLAMRPLRDRSRDLARNTPHAPRMMDVFVAHTIGTGLVPVPATGSDRIDNAVQQLWDDWCEQCDVTGQLNYGAMQALALRSTIESGEVVSRFIDIPIDEKINGKTVAVPMQLQLLESDYIDQFRDGLYADMREANDSRLVRSRLGVGLGDFDRRIGLWLWPYHPGEITTLNLRPLVSRFVQADELVHMFKVLRPGQVRGVPWFAPILTTARELADFVDAANVKARIEACFAGFIQNDDQTVPLLDPSQAGTAATIDVANPQAMVTTFEPGMIKELRQGQEIKFAQPTSNTQLEPMMIYDLQAMAAGVGCTYDDATGDLRQASYISLRAGKLVFWSLVSQLQAHTVLPMMCKPTWHRWVSRAILAGRLAPRREGYPCTWVTPAREAINPKDDLDAERNEVRAGRMTPQEFIASKGGNWRRTIDDTAAFFERADKKKLKFDIDPRYVDQHGRQPPATARAAADADSEDDATDAAAADARAAENAGGNVARLRR